MTLAQVQGSTVFVIYMIITWTALIMAMALALPRNVERARHVVHHSFFKCLFVGLAMLIPVAIAIGLLRSPVAVAKILGFVGLLVLGAALAIGSSGTATIMGNRITELSGESSPWAGFLRGSIIYSLALGFPILGWFVFTPVALIVALGAGTLTLKREPASTSSNLPGNYDPLNVPGAA